MWGNIAQLPVFLGIFFVINLGIVIYRILFTRLVYVYFLVVSHPSLTYCTNLISRTNLRAISTVFSSCVFASTILFPNRIQLISKIFYRALNSYNCFQTLERYVISDYPVGLIYSRNLTAVAEE